MRPDDCERVAALVRQLDYPATSGAMRRRLEAMDRRPDYAGWVAVDEVVVGFVGASIGYSFVLDEPYGRVIALVVDESLRGTGIGIRLLSIAETWLAAAGVHRVMITSATRREAAHRFYERHGYEITGVRLAKHLGRTHTEPVT